MVALTAGAGVCLGAAPPLQLPLVAWVILATGLLSGGAACLNQLLENRPDSLMKRTAGRPIPSGRIGRLQAVVFGLFLSAFGALLLIIYANTLAALLGLLTSVIYLFAYTPLKRYSTICTTVGAVPGAVPPLIGWAAATGNLNSQAWSLFLILFLWQYPHFLAIAWIYKEDYEKAGFKMLPMLDLSGEKTSKQVVIFSSLLLISSVLPVCLDLAGRIYLVGALSLGALQMIVSLQLRRDPSTTKARSVLRASVIYLPILLILLMIDKI
jgi:protoheme IX farnesyltransferase